MKKLGHGATGGAVLARSVMVFEHIEEEGAGVFRELAMWLGPQLSKKQQGSDRVAVCGCGRWRRSHARETDRWTVIVFSKPSVDVSCRWAP